MCEVKLMWRLSGQLHVKSFDLRSCSFLAHTSDIDDLLEGLDGVLEDWLNGLHDTESSLHIVDLRLHATVDHGDEPSLCLLKLILRRPLICRRQLILQAFSRQCRDLPRRLWLWDLDRQGPSCNIIGLRDLVILEEGVNAGTCPTVSGSRAWIVDGPRQ